MQIMQQFNVDVVVVAVAIAVIIVGHFSGAYSTGNLSRNKFDFMFMAG